MRGQGARDREIARIANRQGGIVARAQLCDLELSPKAIDHRVRSGRLHPIHRGVYAVGHQAIGVDGRWWAAVLALGDVAVLSHFSAASAWDVRRSASGLIHVTVPGSAGRKRRAGIRVHRPERLTSDEVTTLDGLPITTPARTLLDLAASGLRGRELEAVLDRAELLRLLDFGELAGLLARRPRRAGAPAISATLSRYVPGTVDTRSLLEELVLELCDVHGLLRPLTNETVAGRKRDFYWPHARLVVETDGYTWHRSPSAMSEDRERDTVLVLAGYRVLRFTWEHVTRRADYVARSLLAALGATPPRPGRLDTHPAG
jgi:hypothetical protein